MPDTYLVLSISFDLAFYPNAWVHMLSRSFPHILTAQIPYRWHRATGLAKDPDQQAIIRSALLRLDLCRFGANSRISNSGAYMCLWPAQKDGDSTQSDAYFLT